jgi:hypothetical protein
MECVRKDLPLHYFYQIALAVDTDRINSIITVGFDGISAMAALFPGKCHKLNSAPIKTRCQAHNILKLGH